MPLDLQNESPIFPGRSADVPALTTRVADLNAQLRHHSATDVLRVAVREIPDLALVSSFGADSVALLHLASMVRRDLPVIFIDTALLFTETLVYQQEVAERLGLRNVRIIRANDMDQHDPDDTLHKRDADTCCHLRKTLPLQTALHGYAGWITGRKRFQSGGRANLDFFEVDTSRAAPALIKVNPLAHWAPEDIAHYMTENRLPRHPMIAQGYPSIGCAPCTSPVTKGEDPRAGRWREARKDECGIHLVNGKMARTGVSS